MKNKALQADVILLFFFLSSCLFLCSYTIFTIRWFDYFIIDPQFQIISEDYLRWYMHTPETHSNGSEMIGIVFRLRTPTFLFFAIGNWYALFRIHRSAHTYRKRMILLILPVFVLNTAVFFFLRYTIIHYRIFYVLFPSATLAFLFLIYIFAFNKRHYFEMTKKA